MGMSLFWRLFAVNAAIFVVGTLALALSPATVSFPVRATESIVLVVGLTVILLVNLLLVRLTLAPLERLMGLMRRIDLLRPGARLDVSGPPEVRDLGHVFNDMLDRLEAERRESGRRALAAQEGERKRVAQELHDEVGQTLTAVLLQLQDLAARVPPELEEPIRHAQEGARGSLEDVRAVARQLRPEALDDLGLRSALAALCARVTQGSDVRIVRRLPPELPELDAEAELVVYRVAQESLTNALRHGAPRHVELALEQRDGAVILAVRDDGRGLAGAAPGHGIRGMRERALLVGGRLRVEDSPRGGVEVTLEIPTSSP
jgi:two-component system, NarL family, sensor histidine kinase UhpB